MVTLRVSLARTWIGYVAFWVHTASLLQERWTRWCCGVEGLYGKFCGRSFGHGVLVVLGPYGEFAAGALDAVVLRC